MNTILRRLVWNVRNALGWKSPRRIVVIESDDWGTIRMASKEAFDFLLKKRFPVGTCAYNSFDSLESNEDLEYLFETLSSVKDRNGRNAVLTANNIVANPCFGAIRESSFQKYFYEPFTETLKRYPNRDRVLELYYTGMNAELFRPQFHGREHVNVTDWMQALADRSEAVKAAFDLEMFSVHAPLERWTGNEFMDSLNSTDDMSLVIGEGLSLFKKLWGFSSKSFIAPCYIWSSGVEETLKAHGVRYIQGTPIQLEPIGLGKVRRRFHLQGRLGHYGHRYLIRNAFFEPSTNSRFDWVDACLGAIDTAFKWHAPAIISSHRVNFIGAIVRSNRDNNLRLLRSLLKKITNRWPDVEFMSSDELGAQMNKCRND